MTHGNRIPGYSPNAADSASHQSSDCLTSPLDESQRLAQVAANLPGMVCQFQLRPDGTCLFPYVSSGIKAIYRLEPKDVQNDGALIFERIHPDDLARFNTSVRESATRLTLWQLSYRLRFDNGDITWVQGRAMPQRLEDGSVLWNGLVTDITEQKKTTLDTSHPESLFRKMADASPVLIWMFGADGQMEYINKTLLNFLGQPMEEMLGNGWRQALHHDDLDPAYTHLMACMKAFQPFEYTLRNRRYDGNYRTVTHWARPWFHDDGSLGGYIGCGIDVTDQKEAQDAVVKMRDQLDSILTSLPEVVYSLSPDLSKNYFVGSATQSVYGRPPKDFLEDPNLWLKVIHSDDVPRIEAGLEELNRTDKSSVEYRITRPDGSIGWVSDNARIIRDKSGTALRIDGIVSDITQRIQASSDLLKARDAAQSASQHKSEFLASMSHEIRTPMTAIVGYAHLLSSGRPTLTEQSQWSAHIRRNSDYLLNLVNDILDLSKIEAGQIQLQIEPVDVWAVAQSAVSLMSPRVAEKMLAFDHSRFGDTPVLAHTDANRLRQILVNLLSNAIKFTDSGAIGLEMSSENDPQTGRTSVIFTVSDTGVGIDPDNMDRLFKPFSRIASDTPGSVRPGTGLGLVISMKFAKMLGGSISVESVPQQGSRFTVRIDAGETRSLQFRPESQQSSAILEQPSPSVSQNALTGTRILVTDDNIDNQRIIRFILEQSGATVELANHGHEATERIMNLSGRTPIDLVLMDMQMPVCDGYNATRILRTGGCTLPVIALTAYTMSSDKQKCLDAGCTSYLTKPIVPDTLVQEVLKHLPARAGRGTDSSPVSPSQTTPAPSPATAPTGLLASGRFADLVKDYLAGLVKTRHEILAHLMTAEFEPLRVLAHKLKGSGSSYGFPQITQAAAQCESLIKAGQSPEKITEAGRALIQQIDIALARR